MKQTETAGATGGKGCHEPMVLETIVNDAPGLLSSDHICVELYRYIHTQSTSTKSLTNIISAAPNHAAQILKIANNLGPESNGKVSTIEEALRLLSREDLNNLVMGISARRVNSRPNDNYYSAEAYWQHSVFVGLCCKYLAMELAFSDIDMFFMAGLLHDIGLPAMYSTRPLACRLAKEQTQDNEIALAAYERQLFGFDHGKVGGELLKKWQLPERLVSAITYHHQPAERPDSAILYLAELIARAVLLKQAPERFVEQHSEYDLNLLLNLNKKKIKLSQLINKVNKEKSRISSVLLDN